MSLRNNARVSNETHQLPPDIWYLLQDHERYVYHYTTAPTLAKILSKGQLRFSRFEDVNDPRESKDWEFSYCAATVSLATFEPESIQSKLNQLLKRSWRIGCFVIDPYEALATKERDDRGEDISGAMYERGHSRPRMWELYGDKYSGACLIFDKAHLDADIRSFAKGAVFANNVAYCNPTSVANLRQPDALMISLDELNRDGVAEAVKAHVLKHWRELFFVKSRDWEQEREYRWVINSTADFYVDIRKSLVGVALGDRFPQHLKAAVGKFAEDNPVSVAVMNWRNGVPQPSPTYWRLLIGSGGR